MSKFNVKQTPIEGLIVLEPIVINDKKGFSLESYSLRDFEEIGIIETFVQESHTKYSRGVLKGLEFQREQTQGRLIRVVSGTLLSVAVDLRPESESYGASHSVEISAENKRMFYIPPYFAHGFLTLEADTELICKYSDYGDSKLEGGVVWNDPILAINWQFERYDIDQKRLNITDREKKYPSFRQLDPKTLWKK